MNIIEMDILSVESGIILHHVNLHGSMGGGIAYAIANKWPHVNDLYKDFCKNVRILLVKFYSLLLLLVILATI